MGEGFEVMMSLQKSDQLLAMSVLNSFNATLKALGYAFYFEADGIPKELEDMTKRQVILIMPDPLQDWEEGYYSMASSSFLVCHSVDQYMERMLREPG